MVHAAKGMSRREYQEGFDALFATGWPVADLPRFEDLERGGIIGSVEIVDCVTDYPSRWFSGPFGFVLRDPRPLPFRSLKGRLGFFEGPA
jgi:hypothetical protein